MGPDQRQQQRHGRYHRTVNPVNDAPDAVNDTATTSANTPRTINVLGNDVDLDGDPLSVAAVGTPANGSATLNLSQTVAYTPSLNFTGADVFTYTISDTGGLTDTATVTVSVGVVNNAPNAVDDRATTLENTAVTIAVLNNDTDPEGDSLSVIAVDAPTSGTAATDGTTANYTPNPSFKGVDFFTYTISDGNLTDTATVTVTVAAPTSSPWEEDHFDELALGPLHGQNGWTKARADRASPVVVAESPGKVLLIDAAAGATIVMGKDVPDQTGGRHTFVVRVKVISATLPSLAKIEVRTNPAAGWDKKFQLYFGSSMRVNYSPSGLAVTLVPTTTMGSWYHIRGELDLAQELLDVWVNNSLVADDIPMHRGPITDLGLSGWDRPGAVYLDDIVGLETSEPGGSGPEGGYWINSQGGSWAAPTNWSTGALPTASQHAFITLDRTYTITLDTTTTVGRVTLGAATGQPTLWIKGNGSKGNVTLNVINDFTNSGVIHLESENFGYASNLTIANGILTNLGVVRVNQGSGGNRTISGRLTNRGSVRVNHNLAFAGAFSNVSTLNIATGRTMSVVGSAQVFHQNAGTIAGSGILALSAGATLNFNSGSTSGAAPVLTHAKLNFGISAIGVAAFTLRGNSQLSGDIGAEQTVWIKGDGTVGNTNVTATNSLANYGVILLESENFGYATILTIANDGTVTNLGVINVNQGSGGNRGISGNVVNLGTFNVNQILIINSAFTNSGMLAIAAGQKLSLTGSAHVFNQDAGTIAGNGVLELSNAATLNFNSGTIADSAVLELSSGATLISTVGRPAVAQRCWRMRT